MKIEFQKLILHAPNVNNGGGKSLLLLILNEILGYKNVRLNLDIRMFSNMPRMDFTSCKFFRPSVVQRFLAEFHLYKISRKDDVVLCFGNLPPLFKLSAYTTLFLQNRYLIEKISLKSLPIKVRIRLYIERLWLTSRAKNVNLFIVQSPQMKNLLRRSGLSGDKPIVIRPLFDEKLVCSRAAGVRKLSPKYEFIYVASGEAHKNHLNLIKAWILLSEDGIYPALWLTLDSRAYPELWAWISKLKNEHKLVINNLELVSSAELSEIYLNAGALIYPSLLESFGLPLVEAMRLSTPVIASELDFVRDILDPDETFDPRSPVSIARAVKRFLGHPDASLQLMHPNEFLKTIVEKCEE